MKPDFQNVMDALCQVERDETLKNSPQLTLGELIAKLESKPADLPVAFDFDDMYPTGLCSWRGSYNELAIQFDDKESPPTVEQFVKRLKEAVGQTFVGYKGGEYIMGRRTPIWVDNYGVGDHRAPIGIKEQIGRILILTAMCEF